MLVCNVSQRPPRRAIAADLAEAGAADDASTTSFVVFATLVDDPASVIDIVDAYSGEIMRETAIAADSVSVGIIYASNVVAAVTAISAEDATVTATFIPTTWNSADKSSGAVVGGTGNLTLSASSGGSQGARSTNPLNSGKAYFEITVNVSASSGCTSGIAKGGVAPDLITGNPANGGVVAMWVNGNIFLNATAASGSTLGTISNSDVICVAADLGAKTIWFRKNAGNWNGSGTANPATATGGLSFSTLTGPYYGFSGTASGSESSTANFGATSFAQIMPSGFSSWNSLV